MSANRLGWTMASVLGALVLSAAPQPAYADPAADFDKLKQQFDEQYHADKNRDAEKTAVQLRLLAEGPLRDKPALLGTAIYCQGIAVHWQRRYNDAAPLLETALKIREKAIGTEHADAIEAAASLALCYFMQDRYREAEPLCQRVLALREKTLGAEHADVIAAADSLADCYQMQDRYKEAEPLYQRVLAVREKTLGAEHADAAAAAADLGDCYHAQRRYKEAEPLYQRALATRKKALGTDHLDVAQSLRNLASLYQDQGRFAEAEPFYQRALTIREKALGTDHPDVGDTLDDLARLCQTLARYAEAEALYRRALAVAEKSPETNHAYVAWTLDGLGGLNQDRGNRAEAEALYRRSLVIREKAFGPDHLNVAQSLGNLASVYHGQGRFAEAESFYRRALAIREKVLGPDHSDVGDTVNDLAGLYQTLGRYAEAEALYQRALAVVEKSLGTDDLSVASPLDGLGGLNVDRGNYAEAEAIYRRALAIREKALGKEHPDLARNVAALADLYWAQERYAEAETLARKSLDIREKALGKNHPDVAESLNNLANVYHDQRRYAEAETAYRRALAIYEKAFGPDSLEVADILNNLAEDYRYEGRYADAEPLYERSKAIWEKKLGPEHPNAAYYFLNIALVRNGQKRHAEAEPLVDRAIAILERSRIRPNDQLMSYELRANLAWKAGRRAEAVADLRRAMELAELQRGRSSGSERERAQFFGKFTGVFETMVAWQAEMGDMNEVLAAIERGRARSLLDEMNVGGADLQVGRSALEREKVRRREAELKSRVASLTKQLDQGAKLPDAEKRRLQSQLADSREALYQHHREDRASNPVYRNLLSVGAAPPRLSQIQRRLAGSDGLLLAYLFGGEGGRLLVVGPSEARLVAVSVSPNAAEILGVEPGPLTAKCLQAVLTGKAAPNAKAGGVLQQLADPTAGKAAVSKLAALWQLLVPEPERKALTGGKIKRLIVIPDGPLALLPFETLVVEPGEQPRYLLDAGPAILYGPSATVLLNLSERPLPPAGGHPEPVLTVGNPAYSSAVGAVASAGADVLNQLAASSRYSAAGGKLTQLPFSGWESSWVADAFGRSAIKAARLEGAGATEARLRAQVSGRRIVHLACHGLADQSYGNFYGALALAPGKNPADSADDGFLTLPEIYELDLKACELAILSACETNYGPEQRGEGVWALSRGFLVAGARRVVASNWLVDDEAAASLISYFCGGLAAAEKEGSRVDYAQALHNAQRWVRQQDKWSSPYYWGTFVFMGPN